MTRRQAGALLLLLVTACAEATRMAPRGPPLAVATDGHGYEVDVVERGAVPTRPVPVSREELQRALPQLLRGIRLDAPPPALARRLLEVGLEGDWLAEVHHGKVFTLTPLDEKTPLAPVEDEALRREYQDWCKT